MPSQRYRPRATVVAAVVTVFVLLGLRASPRAHAAGGPLTLAWSSSAAHDTTAVAWGDMDGDGDEDLALGGQLRLYRNDGDGDHNGWPEFADVVPEIVGSTTGGADGLAWDDHIGRPAWGDADNDGDYDLVLSAKCGSTPGRDVLYVNKGDPDRDGRITLREAWKADPGVCSTAVAWGDFDGDGLADLVFGARGGEPNRLYRNAGAKADEQIAFDLILQWTEPPDDVNLGLAWGDFDRDRCLDLAVAHKTHRIELYHNDGRDAGTRCRATFTDVWNRSAASDPLAGALAWADFDADGSIDLAVGSAGKDRIYRFDELGNLATGGKPDVNLAWESEAEGDTTSIAAADVDGDGCLDLFVGNLDTTNRLYRGDGWEAGTNRCRRTFTDAAWSTPTSDRTAALAVGDFDADGRLDVVVGTEGPIRVYRNDGSDFKGAPVVDVGPSSNRVKVSVAWGDVDGDGDLDLALGKDERSAGIETAGRRLYVNRGDANADGVPDFNQVWPSGPPLVDTSATSVAWGDFDADGDLDLVVGGDGSLRTLQLYRNDGRGLNFTAEAWSYPSTSKVRAVAWADVEGDGDLDLAIGTDGDTQLYRNDGGAGKAAPVSFNLVPWLAAADKDYAFSVAWGDYDDDGDPDLAVGRRGSDSPARARVYRNDGGALSATPAWQQDVEAVRASVAWGDYDGDGDLDLAVGSQLGDGRRDPNRVYRNDGDPDNDGDPEFVLAWSSFLAGCTTSVAWGDYDADGDLDLTASIGGETQAAHDEDVCPNTGARVYRNDHGVLMDVGDGSRADNSDSSWDVAWGDVDADGDLDLAIGPELHLNPRSLARRARAAVVPFVQRPAAAAREAGLLSAARILTGGRIVFDFRLLQKDGAPARAVKGYFSLNGGGSWQPAAPAGPFNRPGDLTSAPYAPPPDPSNANRHAYDWNVFAGNVMGSYDNVVFRLAAFPVLVGLPDRVPGPFLFGSVASTSLPFRIRGTQVHVYRERVAAGQEAVGASVYRLNEGRSRGAALLATRNGRALVTDRQGFLQGHADLAAGDQLIAVLPVNSGDPKITLLQTSTKPLADGRMTFHTASPSGVQTVTVSAANPLALLNLNVALEWDARKDEAFLGQLERDLQRTSELLYDWSNGQVALGNVTVYHDAPRYVLPTTGDAPTSDAPWLKADVRVYASNRLGPNAAQGGIVATALTETLTVDGRPRTTVYAPGLVRMGASWNRYGEASGSIGEDWPRALAHELGHYALYLDDTYLGANAQGQIIHISNATCPGVMNDPYRDVNSEFQSESSPSWQGCKSTLPYLGTGRSDWATIERFHAQRLGLHRPAAPADPFADAHEGPSVLPLAVTRVRFADPPGARPPDTLDDPTFLLTTAGSNPTPAPGGAGTPTTLRARAFLLRPDRIIDVGAPAFGRVTAYGARRGDRLCVFDPANDRSGCLTVQQGLVDLPLTVDTGWHPQVRIEPSATNELRIVVRVAGAVVGGSQVHAQLFPSSLAAPPMKDLTCVADPNRPGDLVCSAAYDLTKVDESTRKPLFPVPPVEGFVRVWLDGNGGTARRETVTDYALGGNPVPIWGKSVPIWGKSIPIWGKSVPRRTHDAPAVSSDGEVSIHGEALERGGDDGWLMTLQAATNVPDVPTWVTHVGQAYWLATTPNPPALDQASIVFHYHGRDVPPGEERGLQIYFWDAAKCDVWDAAAKGSCWEPLPRADDNLDPEHNVISAQLKGPGLYALMSSVEMTLRGRGWTLIGFPVQRSPSVSEALRTIDGKYNQVYGWNDALDRWELYAPGAPVEVNTLRNLEFGHGYWIHLTVDGPVVLKLRGGFDGPATGGVAAARTQGSGPDGRASTNSVEQSAPGLPPATFFGRLLQGNGFVPAGALSVAGWIGGARCGESTSRRQPDGSTSYVLQILAEGGLPTGRPGCGVAGRSVSFRADDWNLKPTAGWSNDQVWALDLTGDTRSQPPIQRIYLPVAYRAASPIR